jgi:hypothetical protein
MAKAKTGAFYLTEQVILSASSVAAQANFSLATYIDVASKQGLAIETVDFMFQGVDAATGGTYSQSLESIGANVAPWSIGVQLLDVQRGIGIVSDGDRALVGSGTLIHQGDPTGGVSHESNLYPDNYGPVATEEARLIVNSDLFLNAISNSDFSGSDNLAVTCRIKCRIVTLSERDFMAIAITSSAADN